MIFEKVSDFDLDLIFDCGQCFRWEKKEEGNYVGIAGKRVAKVSYTGGNLVIDEYKEEPESKKFWQQYFDLCLDYGQICDELKEKDRIFAKAFEYGKGIRILRQDKWETLVSFIISANNNIPRIKKNINSLAQEFGTWAGEIDGENFYALPEPLVLSKLTPEDLAPCKLGYRAKYLIETSKQVCEGEEIHQENLLKYCGVGPKVADCIALFSMGAYDRFPIDVWVQKLMGQLYGIESKKAMTQFAKETFGDYCGIAQQFLFYYMRYIESKNK